MAWFMVLSLLPMFEKPLESGVPQIGTIFLNHQIAAWRQLLPQSGRVRTDLRPLLLDFGHLSNDQTAMVFQKLVHRYEILEAEVHNSQSDTNYGWLDIYLQARIRDRRSQRIYNVIFSVQFKISASRWTISQWVIQDVF